MQQKRTTLLDVVAVACGDRLKGMCPALQAAYRLAACVLRHDVALRSSSGFALSQGEAYRATVDSTAQTDVS